MNHLEALGYGGMFILLHYLFPTVKVLSDRASKLSTIYIIQIFNTSNINRIYSLFQSVPIPDGMPDCFNNVYQKSPTTVSGNSNYCLFSMKKTFYAIYGTS
ncbi:hypothetical protein BDZ45DRAFT_806340, partial [Acephala macrosclerotiorum]